MSPAGRARPEGSRRRGFAGRRGPWSRLGGVAVAAVSAVLITLAVIDPGFSATDPRLHDGSVYVTNDEAQQVGKLNRQIDELSGAATVLSPELDVLQDGTDVAVLDRATWQLTRLDAGALTLDRASSVPAEADLGLRAGRLVISNPATGAMWSRAVREAAEVDFRRATPDLDLGPGGRSTVTVDGTAVGVSPERSELVTLAPGADPQTAARVTTLPFSPSRELELTTVGDRVVVLDRGQGLLWRSGDSETVEVPDADRVLLQAPSDRVPVVADGEISVVLAGPTGLLGLAGDRVVALADELPSSRPSRPVVVAGCAWGAFATQREATVLNRCDRTAAGRQAVPDFEPGDPLVLRTNRDEVVLNDTAVGSMWLVTENMRLIAGWDKVTPPKDGQGSEVENDDLTEVVNPNRSAENRPPRARNDAVTVRAGQTTPLPLTDNDDDPDGDILTFAEPDPIDPATGVLGRIRGGTGLQLAVPATASGTVSFRYTIVDGRGGEDTAGVTVRIVSGDQQVENSAPYEVENPTPMVLTSGTDAQARVLLDWRDPEGDDLTLESASVEGDDEVTITPDGQLTFRDAGTKTGRKEISIVVSDGVDTTEGTVAVQVSPRPVPPQAFGDFATAQVGQRITIDPLLNDVGDGLVLSRVDQGPQGTEVERISDTSFTFRAQRPGTVYLSYAVSNGPRAIGLIRIDVLEPAKQNRPPVAARDQVRLPAGGTATVDPLANDSDPDDDVLVVQSVSPNPAVSVKVIRRQLLQITAVKAFDAPIVLTYTVSDGRASADGSVVLLPIEVTRDQPVAVADTLTVRAGDTGAVRVLANDRSPSGQELRLVGLTEEPAGGRAWVAGEYVRFTAPAQPGEYNAVYELADAQGRKASAPIRIFVIDDAAENTPPEPQPVVDRVLAGTTARILIPLRGIDPEGDTVRLLGVDVPPALGTITQIDDGQLIYSAFTDAGGTDSFTYRVVDARGAVATGTIRVGVVPRGVGNAPPTAVDDAIRAKPAQRVRVPVLANDSDPDGDTIAFAAEPTSGLIDPQVIDNRIVEFTVPDEPGTTAGTYTIVDSRGAESTGTIRISSDPAAPPQAPVLTDDLVPSWEVLTEDLIKVPVLDNDFDPDGSMDTVTLSVPDDGLPPERTPTVVGREVQVRVTDRIQVLRYQVTDPDGQVAYATITVPGRGDATPVLKPDITPQEVVAGEPREFDITQFVQARPGRPVRLVSDERVWGARGDARATGPTTVSFVAPVDYVGPANISFEVGDARQVGDEDGRTAVLTVPIKVLPAPKPPPEQEEEEDEQVVNRPPEVAPVTLTVAAGEPAKSIDLSLAVRDPEDDPIRFSDLRLEAPAGVRVSLDGARLVGQAERTAQPGSRVRGTVRVSDGTNTVDLTVTLAVTATTKPPPEAVDDVVERAVQGRSVSVPVLENDVNPFPDEPLSIVRAVVETGGGDSGARVDGSQVVVTPAEDFVGTMIVRYTVEDATGLEDRRAEGRIRLTVEGRPDRPGTPREVEVGDRRAVVDWTAPDDNGAPITGYTVRAAGARGVKTQSCPTTTCTITGLVNDVAYTFTVVATNRVGDSDASAASAAVTPDVRPEAPGTPTLKFGDRQLSISWRGSVTRGSAVQDYEIELSGPNGLDLRKVGAGTSYTWTGLTNGSAYTARVRAYNKVDRPSNYSGRSKPETPAGKPGPPTLTSATDDSASSTGRGINLQWQAPLDTNGAAITRYTVVANGTRTNVPADGGSVINYRLSVPANTTYTVSVIATNKAGSSGESNAATVVVYAAPPAANALRVSANGDTTISVDASFPPSEEKPQPYFEMSINNGAPQALQNRFAAQAGQQYSVRVRSCRTNGNTPKCSGWAGPESATAYAPPEPPSMSRDVRSTSAGISWSAPANSNGRPVQRVEYRLSGSTATVIASARQGSASVDGYSKTLTVRTWSVNSEGQRSREVERTVRTDDPPPPPPREVRVSKGDRMNASNCVTTNCRYIVVSVENFAAGSSIPCTIRSQDPGGSVFSGYANPYQVSTNGSGSGSRQTTGYYGYPGGQVWAECNGVQSPRFTW